MNSLDTIPTLKKRHIIELADEILKTPFVSVIDKKKSLTGNPNDYESLATYFWPDSATPGGRYIAKDGQRNPETDLYCTPLIYSLSHKLKYTCEAYFITNEARYAQYAREQILHWFINQRSHMKPDFEYGQFIPGGEYTKGNIGTISEAYYLIDALEAIALLKDNKFISNSADKELKSWFTDFSTWMKTSVIGTKMKAANDNCGIMYDVLLYRISAYTGDKSTCKEIINEFTSKRLHKQIAEDGQQAMELKRANAMDYSIYNLDHIIDFCIMLRNKGIPYYDMNSERIITALDYISKFTDTQTLILRQKIGRITTKQ